MPSTAVQIRLGTARRPRVLAALTALALALGWIALAVPSARADGPTSFSNTTSIAVPGSGAVGPASPYPSTVAVSGLAGVVSKVTVTFRGLTHGSLGDVDAMVVAPSGANLVVLSDIRDGALSTINNSDLTFDDAAAFAVPGQVVVPGGTYRPTNQGDRSDVFPGSAPAPSGQTTLAGAFAGIDPNGTWRLFVVDDVDGDVGSMAGGWTLTVTTATTQQPTTTTVTSSDPTSTTGDPVTFTATVRSDTTPVTAGTVQFSRDGTALGGPVPVNSSGVATLTTSGLAEGTHLIRATYSGSATRLTSNGTVTQRVDNATTVSGRTYCNPGPISVPDSGAARPYPSNVFVTGLSGQISKVTAKLSGLTHSSPQDLDVLLSGPDPAKNLFLITDAGGRTAASGVDLTFDDAAAGTVPAPPTSGMYRPTRGNDLSTDEMPAPAPAPGSATTLSTLAGGDPNGTWSLWVVDDATGDAGSIAGGWCVTISSQSATTTTLTTTPNPSSYGRPVRLAASVAAGGAPVRAGTVQFYDGTNALGRPVPVDDEGVARYASLTFQPGTHPITAVFSGTDDLAGSRSAVVDQVVTQAVTSIDLSALPASSQTVGRPVTFYASVSSSAYIDQGTLTFSVDGVDEAPIAVEPGGDGAFTTAGLGVGTHTIEVRYTSSSPFISDSRAELSYAVTKAASGTTVTSSANPSRFGDPVTFTATVTSDGAPVTTGSVEFSDSGTTLGAVTIGSDGTATLTTSALSAGSHIIKAAYAGTTYADSQDQLTQVVGRQTSTTAVVSDLNPSAFGTSVTFTATATAGGSPASGGTVQFSEDGDRLGAPVPVASDGTATFSTATLTTGTHTITATYSGTTDVSGSSGSVVQVVGPAPTTTKLTSSADPQTYADVVFLQASVTSGATQIIDGTVTFTEGSTVLCTAVVLAPFGYADCGVNRLGVGTHELTATFSGTDDYASSSTTISQRITIQQGATTTLESSVNPSTLGSEVTFTATVADDGDPVVEGTVEFSVDGTVVALAQPIDQEGAATYVTDALTAGRHTITAKYSGTANVDAGEPGQLTQEVQLVANAGEPYRIAEGQGVSLDSAGSSPGATYAWDLDYDGTTFVPDVTGPSATLSWTELQRYGIDDGGASATSYPVALRVSVGVVSITKTTEILVTNTAPSASVDGRLQGTVGTPFTVKVGADDPSSVDLAADFTYTVDWGDGSPVETVVGPADPPVTHTYARAGDFAAAFTATDKDGGEGERTAVTVVVGPAAPPTSPSPPPTSSPSNSGPSSSAPPSSAPTTSGPSHPGSDDLADTGSVVGPGAIVLGGSLLLAGAALLVLAGRRRHAYLRRH